MAQVEWTPQAADDLDAIGELIAADSPRYAELFVLDVLQATERLAEFPKSGRVVPELGKDTIREVILGNYRIIYHLRATVVEVLTVFHGAKLLDPERLK